MKIAHINFGLSNGGLENMMVDIANLQAKAGHDVSIIIINDSIDQDISNRISSHVTTYFTKRKKGSKNLFALINLFWAIYRNNYDIIHSHTVSVGFYLRFIRGPKKIITLHGLNKNTSQLKYYDRLISISEAVKDDVVERSGLLSEVILNGINTKKIKVKNNSYIDRSFKIVQVSRLLHEKKGQDLLLHAINEIIKQKKINALEVHFVGDGPSRSYLINLANQLSIQSSIKFLGNKPRQWVYDNLCNYDLFVQPSRFEGFGLTVAEAMAAKIPVVVADNDGPSEIINKGEYGWMFKSESVKDLTEKIIQVYNYSENDLNELTERAYNHCVTSFDVNATSRQYLDHYQKILSQ